MSRKRFSPRLAAIAIAAAAVLALPSAASAVNDPSECTQPSLTQPFTAWKDFNWYTLVDGQSDGSFDGTGWTLTGGASIVTTTLADGTTTTALDLPSGSKAVSPTVCVTSDYPTARTMVRNVKGSEGVFFYVSYAGTSTWDNPKNTGQVHGKSTVWTLSDPVNVQPSSVSGWQVAKFTFIPGGKTSDFQIYNFYVDPHMR
jgi:hypothetical protein